MKPPKTDYKPAIIMGTLLSVMMGSVMLFSEYMQKKGEALKEKSERER